MNKLIQKVLRTGIALCGVCGVLPANGGTDPFENWHQRASPAPGRALFEVTYGSGLFLAVGAGGLTVKSTDGINWTGGDTGATNDLDYVCYGNGTFMAAAKRGPVLRSTDAVKWESTGWRDPGAYITGLAFANGSFFLIVEEEGLPRFYVSTNGMNWRWGVPLPRNGALLDLAYTNGRYVLVGFAEPDWPFQWDYTYNPLLLFSDDAVTWHRVVMPKWTLTAEIVLLGVAYGEGVFVAVGKGINGIGLVIYSIDGSNWKVATGPFFGPNAVAYGAGMFYITGDFGAMYVSQDGAQWRQVDPGFNYAFASVTYGRHSLVGIPTNDWIFQSDPLVSLTMERSPVRGLSIDGPAGRACRIEATSALEATVQWQPIATVTLTNEPTIWKDPGAALGTQRYYRAVLE